MTSKHFKAYTLPFSDPDLIDDATEVYGDNDNEQDFPWIVEVCEASPVGQCEYSFVDPDRCIHCGRKT